MNICGASVRAVVRVRWAVELAVEELFAGNRNLELLCLEDDLDVFLRRSRLERKAHEHLRLAVL